VGGGRRLRHPNILLLMAVCYTNDMDDLVLLYERVDSGSLHTYLYQKVGPFTDVLISHFG